MAAYRYLTLFTDMSGPRLAVAGGEKQKVRGSLAEALDALGAEGWDLVTVWNGDYIFKRPVP